MNIDTNTIIWITCTFTAVLSTYNLFSKWSSPSLIEYRIKNLENELLCLKVLIKFNQPKFTDHIIKHLEEFQDKLNETTKH